MVIADNLAPVVNLVYSNPQAYSGVSLTAATIAFSFQIFCDFSGYSDIAIGSARILGFDLMVNFRRPYFAQSIPDFWKRWHISLSTWFQDYLYIPLGGSRAGFGRWFLAVSAVFLLSGLWHGANWTFIAWGALHAFYYFIFKSTTNLRATLDMAIRSPFGRLLLVSIRIVCTFFLVAVAWIFFRAESVRDAVSILIHLGSGWQRCLEFATLRQEIWGLNLTGNHLLLILCSLAFMEGVHLLEEFGYGGIEALQRLPLLLRWPVYLGLTLTILNASPITRVPFIYFQF